VTGDGELMNDESHADATSAPYRTDRSTRNDGGATVNDENQTSGTGSSLISRRNVLRAGVVGAAGVGILGAAATRGSSGAIAASGTGFTPSKTDVVHLVATDGWVSMPAKAAAVPGFWPDDLAPKPYNMYVFGFRDVTGMNDSQVIAQRGQAQISAPVLGFDEGSEVKITLTNLGLSQRPDLVDGHTLHWHGFNNAIPIFDGVPEMSASVPIGKSITYYYRPHDAGTYMYHCHFEDVEHVQMGMTGLIFVRPKLNYELDSAQNFILDGNGKPIPRADGKKFVFNDEKTAYDREYPIFLTENDPEDHWRDAHIQISDWSTYDAGFALFNGRAFPDTIEPSLPDCDPALEHNPEGSLGTQLDGTTSLERLRYQPRTALMEAIEGETVLIRLAHLGSLRHTITVDGIPLHVIGSDASQLKGPGGEDTSYYTNSVGLGAGESRDILFTAPKPGTYLVYDRNYMNLSNSEGPGYGGMLTHLVVYAANSDAAKTLTAGKTV
jgi:FtsP/CotA-like multicopper oxidase with cupredoxin domain